MTRRAVTALAVLVSMTLATTACQTAPGATATATPTKTATETLNDAAGKAAGQSFKYSLTYGKLLTGDGVQDATGTAATRNVTYTDPASGLVIKGTILLKDGALYVKLDLGPLTTAIPGLAGMAGKWIIVDQKRIGSSGIAGALIPGGDSSLPATFIRGVVTAEKVSDTEIKGTIDLGQAAPKIVPASEIAKLGADAKKVPFTATLDGQGRISKIVINLPKLGEAPAGDLTTTFTDYGAPVTVDAPLATDTIQAPETVYLFLQ